MKYENGEIEIAEATVHRVLATLDKTLSKARSENPTRSDAGRMILWLSPGYGRPNKQRAELLETRVLDATDVEVHVRFCGDGLSEYRSVRDICGVELSPGLSIYTEFIGMSHTHPHLAVKYAEIHGEAS